MRKSSSLHKSNNDYTKVSSSIRIDTLNSEDRNSTVGLQKIPNGIYQNPSAKPSLPQIVHVNSSIGSLDRGENSLNMSVKSGNSNGMFDRDADQENVFSRLYKGHYRSANTAIDSLKTNDNIDDFDEIIQTSVDKELNSMKHSTQKTADLQRMERIHRFIYDQQVQNQLKYSSQSKINSTALPVPKGTISVMLNVSQKDYGFNLNNFQKKIPQKSKFKMKWKTIQWLLANQQDSIKQLFNNYSLMLKFAKNQKNGMNRTQFAELLSYVGLGADQNLTDKLFYIFDDDNSNTVDYQELIIGLEIFKESTIDDKLQVFMELCDGDGNGNIDQQELYNVLKQNLFTHDDKVKLKQIVKQIFKECDQNGDGVLDKAQLLQATTKNPVLRGLLEESIRNVKRVDQLIENDLEEPFHCWVPISANFVNYKQGIHFTLVDQVLGMFEQIENIHEKQRNQRTMFKQAFTQSKQGNNQEQNQDDAFGDSFTQDH